MPETQKQMAFLQPGQFSTRIYVDRDGFVSDCCVRISPKRNHSKEYTPNGRNMLRNPCEECLALAIGLGSP